MKMADKVSSERLKFAKILLGELRNKPLGWTELERRLIRRGGTHSKFSSLMGWLKKNGYVVKMGGSGTRAFYQLNPEKVIVSEDGEISIKI